MAEGEAVTWRWLAGVTMAARRVVAIRREKDGVCRTYNVTALLWTVGTACVVAVWTTWHIQDR
jgi:predicted small integral membrane protein